MKLLLKSRESKHQLRLHHFSFLVFWLQSLDRAEKANFTFHFALIGEMIVQTLEVKSPPQKVILQIFRSKRQDNFFFSGLGWDFFFKFGFKLVNNIVRIQN